MTGADLVIRNAHILDGSGAPAFEGDVAVRDGRICRLGSGGQAREEIDAAGLVLAPGFVDTHTHDDAALLRHPGMEFKLAQGCTSIVIGNCGFSAAPHQPDASGAPANAGLFAGLGATWTDLAGYFEQVERAHPAVNTMALVGHNTIRALVLGEEKQPRAEQVREMRDLVEQALEQGACGFSTGLIYRPGRYSTSEEVIAIAEPLREYGALYATHMRNEGDGLLEAVDETLRIGREVGCSLHISHHKAAGEPNWGKVRDSLAAVDRANEAGADVTLDVYPYTAGSGPLVEYVNLDAEIPDAWASIVGIANCPAFPEYEGRMVPEIAERLSLAPGEAIRRILTAPRGEQTICIHFIIDEADIETNLRHPRVMIGSDGIPDLAGKPHPRLFGTMPRVLARYVRERGVLTLEEAVRRMTSLSCERFGLLERGRIREGWWADLVLFDPDAVRDLATYGDPKREPEGIAAVLVNGAVAYRDGRHTGAGAGRTLRYRCAA